MTWLATNTDFLQLILKPSFLSDIPSLSHLKSIHPFITNQKRIINIQSALKSHFIKKRKEKKEKTGFIIFVNILGAQEIPIGK